MLRAAAIARCIALSGAMSTQPARARAPDPALPVELDAAMPRWAEIQNEVFR